MRPCRGFSLVEILVVMIVVVLMTGLATLNLSSGASERQLEESVDRLMSTAVYALDEAQFSGSDFGLLWVYQTDERGDRVVAGYWRQRLPEGWRVPDRSQGIFQSLVFPEEIDVILQFEAGLAVPLPADAADPVNGATPQWLFTSSGETLPGDLRLDDAETGEPLWHVRWDALGRFERYRKDAEEPFDEYAAAR